MIPASDLDPAPVPPPPARVGPDARPSWAPQAIAVVEILLCSDFPTQFAIGGIFWIFGYGPYSPQGTLRVGYVVWLSFLDAALLIGLILLFLNAHGDRPRDVLFGNRPVAREVAAGLPLIFMALGLGILVLAPLQHFVPQLHTVAHNPLQDLIRTRRDALLFGAVVIVAGGVREEIQRAFILNRFERWLGGGAVGVFVASAAFGAGHLLQGADAAIATGVLGAFWGIVYLRRRSIVAPMVSHTGFDLLQVVQAFLTSS